MFGRHPPNARAQTKQRAERVDVQHVADRLRGCLIQARIVSDNTRAVHKMGDGSELFADLVKNALDVIFHRHIALDRNRLAASFLHSFDDTRSSVRIGLVVHRDIIASCACKFCGGSADPPAAAGNEQDWSRHRLLLALRGADRTRSAWLAQQSDSKKIPCYQTQ